MTGSNDNDADNVVSFRGGPVVAGQRAPNPSCIAALKRILQMAEAGEVVGVAVAYLRYDATADTDRAGTLGGFEMIGAVHLLDHELLAEELKKYEEPA